MITLYHGSSSLFTQFDVRFSQDAQNFLVEGPGIYLTENPDLAQHYGKYLYEVEVTESDITDFTERSQIMELLQKISRNTGFDLINELDIEQFLDGITDGMIAVATLYEEIIQNLDNSEHFYENHAEAIEERGDEFYEPIRKAFLRHTRPVLKYYDNHFDAPIYLCVREAEQLCIRSVSPFRKKAR